jgi:cyclase
MFIMGVSLVGPGWLGAAPADVDMRAERVSPQVLALQGGTVMPMAMSFAVASERGIVVVDTGTSPRMAQLYRQRMQQELQRDDFFLVINTHHHFDHSNGNHVYPEATVIGHEHCPAAMTAWAESLPDHLQRRQEVIARREAELAKMKAGSAEASEAAEWIRFFSLEVESLRYDGFVSTPPEITFDNRLTLHLGDTTLRLISYGNAHTDNDIWVHVPGEVLLVGDTIEVGRLGFFAFNKPTVPRWIEVMDEVLADPAGVGRVFTGHGELPLAQLQLRHTYLKQLWQAVTDAYASGTAPDTLMQQLALPGELAYLGQQFDLDSPEVINDHRNNIITLWKQTKALAAD